MTLMLLKSCLTVCSTWDHFWAQDWKSVDSVLVSLLFCFWAPDAKYSTWYLQNFLMVMMNCSLMMLNIAFYCLMLTITSQMDVGTFRHIMNCHIELLHLIVCCVPCPDLNWWHCNYVDQLWHWTERKLIKWLPRIDCGTWKLRELQT